MPDVMLQPITKHNWKACSQLTLAAGQVGFVPDNLYSIAESQFYPHATPLAIYNAAQQMVGFVMYGRDEASQTWKIFRLMVDAAHQQQGYGRAAMQQVLATLANQPDCTEILICYQDANAAARHLYAQLGFIEQHTDADGKVTAALPVR